MPRVSYREQRTHRSSNDLGMLTHDHRTVTEYVLVDGLRFDLVLALDPAFERLEVHALGGLGAGDRVPFLGANKQGCFRK